MNMPIRDHQGRFSTQVDATSAASTARALTIRSHVAHGLELFAAPTLSWSQPDFGQVATKAAGALGVIPGAAFVSMVWPAGTLLLCICKDPDTIAKTPQLQDIQEAARRADIPFRMVSSTVEAWHVIEALGVPVTRVYRPECNPRFVLMEETNHA